MVLSRCGHSLVGSAASSPAWICVQWHRPGYFRACLDDLHVNYHLSLVGQRATPRSILILHNPGACAGQGGTVSEANQKQLLSVGIRQGARCQAARDRDGGGSSRGSHVAPEEGHLAAHGPGQCSALWSIYRTVPACLGQPPDSVRTPEPLKWSTAP